MAHKTTVIESILAQRVKKRKGSKCIEYQVREQGAPFTMWMDATEVPAELIAAFDAMHPKQAITDTNRHGSPLVKLSLELRWRLLDEVRLTLNSKLTHISAITTGNSRFRGQVRGILSDEEIVSKTSHMQRCLHRRGRPIRSKSSRLTNNYIVSGHIVTYVKEDAESKRVMMEEAICWWNGRWSVEGTEAVLTECNERVSFLGLVEIPWTQMASNCLLTLSGGRLQGLAAN